MIWDGDLAPGQRLIEVDLADKFSVTRAAVRAALSQLAADGLVERIQNRGARVRVVTLDEAVDIYEVRMVLEGLCAAKAAQRIDEAGVLELQAFGDRMRAAVESRDTMSYSQLNQTLHRRIIELSGQVTATHFLDKLLAQIVRHQFRLSMIPGRPTVSLPEHIAIIDAICAGDPAAAAMAAELHIQSVIGQLRRMPTSGGGYNRFASLTPLQSDLPGRLERPSVAAPSSPDDRN
jgi:DNA-binding GntR family transcriptional regulator